MKLPILLVISLSSTLLIGCKKEVSTSAHTDSQVASTETSTPIGMSDNSPTAQVMANTLKGAVALQLFSMNEGKLTNEQKKCLNSTDGTATYLPFAKEELRKTLDADAIKAADEFYTSELGQKVTRYLDQQIQIAQGLPIEGKPIELTAEDQAKIAQFGQSATGQRMNEINTTENAATMVKKLEEFANTEKARCNIS